MPEITTSSGANIRITSSSANKVQGTPNIARAYRGKTLIASVITDKARPFDVIRRTFHNNPYRDAFVEQLLGAGLTRQDAEEILKFE